MNVQIKVCGMRDASNLASLIELNPDFIGFIFYPKSKRYVGETFNPELIKNIPSSIKTVGVFVNEKQASLYEKQEKYQFDYVQLHGDESADLCKELKHRGFKIIKAFSVDDHFDFKTLEQFQDSCDFFLFDTKGENYGGNGVRFNWNILNKYNLDVPFFLSGGVGLDEIDEIKKIDHPKLKVIDINSRFETEPGLKDLRKIDVFFSQLR
jgi:phosphoribosylanthranilate isomerase